MQVDSETGRKIPKRIPNFYLFAILESPLSNARTHMQNETNRIFLWHFASNTKITNLSEFELSRKTNWIVF